MKDENLGTLDVPENIPYPKFYKFILVFGFTLAFITFPIVFLSLIYGAIFGYILMLILGTWIFLLGLCEIMNKCSRYRFRIYRGSKAVANGIFKVFISLFFFLFSIIGILSIFFF